ncbi:hypothetical protein N0M98_19785 [Paenibacillus doosanensis]|uniref:hypothetical protein n=1 Tax=Paenibacillus doosanensis TaxID=1229154 RepID=UPI00217F8CA1|nr:hypothetical protein [Paenibacillus doosanensis]MCS7462365.1 hypothetical protein [Paenibacillus doosanensis]
MEADQNRIGKRRFLFNVDILIEDETNGRALEKLLHLLNGDGIRDYQIKEGVELGKFIELALRQSISKPKSDLSGTRASAGMTAHPSQAASAADDAPTSATAAAKAPSNPAHGDPHQPIWDQLQQFKNQNSLVRLTVVKGKGIKLNIPCRILNFDPISGNVSVYHVDEKQVYLFKINEIDDFNVS